jgi:hypothetical protein
MSIFGTIPVEPHRQNALDLCAPKFEAAVLATLRGMQNDGFDPYVYETLRSNERAKWLHGFGRLYDDDRGIVTNATDALTGWHGFGLAADIISESKQWDAPDSFWSALGAHAAANALAWGGFWKMKDKPHVQPSNLRDSPSNRARQLIAQGGLAAVWREVGADII